MIYKLGFIALILITVSVSCSNSGNKSEQNKNSGINKNALTSIKFESKEFDFGIIEIGENVSHRFKFKNTGNSNLYISEVNADCGCTIVEFSKEAILPREESYIEAVFNSSSYHGLQIKNIKVYSNTKPAENELVIAATVKSSKN